MFQDIQKEISIIVPFFNEEGNVEKLVTELTRVFCGYNYELILVDDGSIDSTLFELAKLKSERILIIPLSKNFGQSTALKAGFDHSRGSIIGIMDGDLQNSPNSLIEMLGKIKESDGDMIQGFRKNRFDPFLKRIPSKVANSIIQVVFKTKLNDIGCSAKVFRRDVLNSLTYFDGFHRYLPLIATVKGLKVIEMPVEHRPRYYGKSKYGTNRVLSVIYHLFMLKFKPNNLNINLHYYTDERN